MFVMGSLSFYILDNVVEFGELILSRRCFLGNFGVMAGEREPVATLSKNILK